MYDKIKILILAGILSLGLIATISQLSYATVPGNNQVVDLSVSGGSPDSHATGYPALSHDGRYVAFTSKANNLVTPNTTGSYDKVFVRDRLTGTTQLGSQSTGGMAANDTSSFPQISDDGRYVVFSSYASNLVANDTNHQSDVFIRDLSVGVTTLVSQTSSGVLGNNQSSLPDVSADGKFVVFRSYANNLVSGLSGTISLIFLKNMSSGTITLISKNSSGTPANSQCAGPQISSEGRIIAFTSTANNLASGDTYNPSKNKGRIYIVDTTENPISPTYIRGDSNGSSGNFNMSRNGSYISFQSNSSDLITGDTNGVDDNFVYDRIRNTIQRISISNSGNEGNASSGTGSVSNDGKHVVFRSDATNLVPNDTNSLSDIFIHNTEAGTTELITINLSGNQTDGYSLNPIISANSRYVSYISSATNLVSGFSGNYFGNIYTSQTGVDYDY